MNRFIVLMAICSFSFFSCSMAPKKGPELAWIQPTELVNLMKKEPRPILVDLYTDWCKWCKVMDSRTYANPKVIAYLQEKYYCVKIDAESKKVITWMGREFSFNPNFGVNDVAVMLAGQQISFPTTVIIPKFNNQPQAVPGFLAPAELEMLVKYFGDGHYPNTAFEGYQKGFRASW
jgi:thiol:disulfide interchange protein